MGPRARVRAVAPLGSGIAQATHAMTVDDAAGRRHHLVLQRWVRPGWETEDPGFDPAKEAAVLDALADGPVPIPRVLSMDPDGSAAGAPALLTERLPGRPPTARHVLRPDTIRVLGTTLVALHRLSVERWTPDLAEVVPAYYPFGEVTEAIIPTNGRRPDLWAEAFRVAGQPPPRSPSILIHRDYHAWNTLWVADRLTGVVDWSSASIGPPAADLGHLLVDLAIDASVDAALGARSAYAAAGGDLSDGRFHQLRTIFDRLTDSNSTDLGRSEVDRLERFLEIVLAERDPASG